MRRIHSQFTTVLKFPLTRVFKVAGIALAFVMPGVRIQAQDADHAEQERLVKVDQQSVQDAKHGRYIAASYGFVSALGLDSPTKITDDELFDQWSQVWSAITGVHVLRTGKAPDYTVSASEIAALNRAQGLEALAEIVARAKTTRVVILDEDHLVPRDRSFALEVAKALRPLGYSILAVEALSRDEDDAVSATKMAKLFADGYVRQSSGYYLNDPVFADFLRQSLKLGYHPISYEATKAFHIEDSEKAQSAREQEQAENIARRALAANPNSKVLVYGGAHHAAEGPVASDTHKTVWMAARLTKLTGIDPLTIDQATLAEAPSDLPSTPLYAIANAKAHGRSAVLMQDDTPVSVGLMGDAVDLQLVHPEVPDRFGRPGWLQGMGRTPHPVPADLLPKSGTRLVQAFVANEAEDAIPIDQVLVYAGQTTPVMMLPDTPVRYQVQEVPTEQAPAPATAPHPLP